MTEKTLYNCHNHIFTDDHIPNDFYPLKLVPAIRIKPLRFILSGAMKVIVPWTKNDAVHRYTSFIKASYRKSQEANLDKLIEYYPPGTKFVILPMDMEHMNAGKVKQGIDQQHMKLAEICSSEKYRDVIIPFAHIDPRSQTPLNRLRKLVEEYNFKGVKIYPTLGYLPSDKVFMEEIYPFMIDNNIPLMAHCSRGFVNKHGIPKSEAHAYADPDNYKIVMDRYPDLRICLAHFGGSSEWKRYLGNKNTTNDPSWVSKICDLLRSDYPNLYTDISYTIFNYEKNIPKMKELISKDERISSRVLFGSDFYMVESKKISEPKLLDDLMSEDGFGTDIFWKIANDNPKKYLGIN